MKNYFKKLLAVGMTLTMAVSLAACGQGDGNRGSNGNSGPANSQNAALAKQYVYSYQDIEFPIDREDYNIADVRQINDKLAVAVVSYDYSQPGVNAGSAMLVSMNPDGSDMQSVALQAPMELRTKRQEGSGENQDNQEDTSGEDTASTPGTMDNLARMGVATLPEEVEINSYEYLGFNHIMITNQQIYGVVYYNYEDYSNPENGEAVNEHYVASWDMEGNLQWMQLIEGLQQEESYTYVSQLLGLEDGTAMLLIGGDAYSRIPVDAEGNLGEKIELKATGAPFQNNSSMVPMPDGKLLLLYYDDNWQDMYMSTYDVMADTLSEEMTLPDSLMYSGYGCIAAGINSDLVYSSNDGIYTFSGGDTAATQMMSFVNSDLAANSFNKILMLDENSFLGIYNDSVNWNTRAAIFTKVNPEDIPDKQVIVFGGPYISSDFKARIIEYNKASNEYRIVIKDYSSFNSNEDYMAAYTQLNNDIISGSMPDILILEDYSMPVENYISKGLLADIGELIAQDEELSQTEFMENVLEAYRVDGKLYRVIPSFYVRTFAGKTSILGERSSWTMEEFREVLASLPEGTQGIGELNRPMFFNLMMQYAGKDFVDVSTGKCNFNSEEFISLLEFANTLPEETDYEAFDDDYWANYQSQYRDNRTLLMDCYISSISDMRTTINGYFGEDITFVGFPTQSGQGSIVGINNTLAISAQSSNKDAAWDFVRYYLTDEYQGSLEWNLPITRKAFDSAAQRAMEKPYYMDGDKKVEYDDTFYINNESVPINPLTQEQVDKVKAFISSVSKPVYYNADVQNIINEEAAAFFSGQKSAEEVVKIIQSRAELFVNENR